MIFLNIKIFDCLSTTLSGLNFVNIMAVDLKNTWLLFSVMSVLLSPCHAEGSKESGERFPQISDSELAELVPDFVDAQSMPWLSGEWGVVTGTDFTNANCRDGGYISIQTSGYVFDVNTFPEPGKVNTSKVSGTVNVSKGVEPGFFHLTPPEWSDSYLRLKPRSINRLEAHLYSFAPDKIEWTKTHEFDLERCE